MAKPSVHVWTSPNKGLTAWPRTCNLGPTCVSRPLGNSTNGRDTQCQEGHQYSKPESGEEYRKVLWKGGHNLQHSRFHAHTEIEDIWGKWVRHYLLSIRIQLLLNSFFHLPRKDT